MANNVLKVKNFLRMAILRKKFLKIKKAVPKIAGLFRFALARKKLANLRLQKLESQRCRKIEQFCLKHANKAKLNEAASKI